MSIVPLVEAPAMTDATRKTTSPSRYILRRPR